MEDLVAWLTKDSTVILALGIGIPVAIVAITMMVIGKLSDRRNSGIRS